MKIQTNKQIRKLYKKREKSLEELNKYKDMMIGSLVLLKRKCGTEKKYPAYFLSKIEKGKTVLTYIRKDEVKKIQSSLNQHKDLKRLTKRICKINEEIFILEREGGKDGKVQA